MRSEIWAPPNPRFTTLRPAKDSAEGHMRMLDDPDPALGSPSHVENFLNYVADGDYQNSFIHRSAWTNYGDGPTPFVIQGGGLSTANPARGSGSISGKRPVCTDRSPRSSSPPHVRLSLGDSCRGM